MPSSTSPPGSRDAHDRTRVFALWLGVLAGPVLTLILLQTNYVMSYVACESRQTWFLHLATAVAAALVTATGAWAWCAGHGPAHLPEPSTPPVSPETCDARMRWMAHVAAASSLWFLIVIFSMSVPVVVLRPCQ